MLGEHLADQVATAYLHLLLGDVAGYLDQLHAVEQGAGDGAEVVGGGDEHHPREIVVEVEVVVVEVAVLLWVEDLEQGGGWVSLEVMANLVDLVEDDNGVVGLARLQGGDDTAGKGADVCAAVSANLGLVVQAAEGNAGVLATERTGYALAQ